MMAADAPKNVFTVQQIDETHPCGAGWWVHKDGRLNMAVKTLDLVPDAIRYLLTGAVPPSLSDILPQPDPAAEEQLARDFIADEKEDQ